MHRRFLLVLLAGFLTASPADAKRTWAYHPEPGLVREREFAFAIDGVHRQAYRFGGTIDGVPTSNLYRQDLDDPELTWNLAVAPGGPPARTLSRAFYDQRRNRLLVLGGYDAIAHADLWSFDIATGTWSQPAVDPGGPDSVLGQYPMTYDSRRDRLIYLDVEGPKAHARVWSLDLSTSPFTWSSLDPDSSFRIVPQKLFSQPEVLLVSSAAYDSLGDRLFVWVTDVYDNGLYGLDLSSPVHFSRIPGVEYATFTHQMAIDAPRNRLVFSTADGLDRSTNIESPLLVSLDLASLSSQIDYGPYDQPPASALNEISCLLGWAVDPIAGTIEVSYQTGRDLRYSLDLAKLTWSATTKKSRVRANDDLAGALDPIGRAIYVYGGSIRAPRFKDDLFAITDSVLFRLDADDPAHQEHLDPPGQRPGPLAGAVAVFDSTGRRVVFYGGADASPAYRSDVWALDLDPEPHWSRITTTSEGPARGRAGAAIDQDSRTMYVVGGKGPGSDPHPGWLWSLDLSNVPAVWTPLLGPKTRVGDVHVGYDRVHHRLIGLDSDSTFTVDLVPKTPVVTYSAYPSRLGVPGYGIGSMAAFDSNRNVMFRHGGHPQPVGQTQNFGPTYPTGAWTGDVFHDSLAAPVVPLSEAHGLMLHDPVGDRLVIVNGDSAAFNQANYFVNDRVGMYGTWTLDLDDAVPARVDLADVAVLPRGVRVRFSGAGAESPLHVERAIDGTSEWSWIGDASEVSRGLYEWIDETVIQGGRYRYRARFVADGGEQWTAVSRVVVVPGAVDVALRAPGSLVGRGWPVVFEGRVRPGIPARIELVDVTGRVVTRRAVTGVFAVSLAPQRASAGIYFARLVQGDRSIVLRLVRF